MNAPPIFFDQSRHKLWALDFHPILGVPACLYTGRAQA